jgi:uncharacterized protein (DUF1330 family)
MPETKAFVVVQIEINDRAGYASYESAPHQDIFDKFGARVIAIDEQVDTIEGRWPFTRTVIIEFPGKDAARFWYESEDYQAVVGQRHASAVSNLVLVSGYPA